MTNTIYLDCHAGIAGDMLLSSLVDLGANIAYIESHLQKLPLNDFKLHFSNQTKQGIQAKQLDIDLPARVKVRSQKVFDTIAHAEAKIHGMSVEEVHFHEVGAMDSIIDIIGGCLALENLKIDELHASPIPTGGGKINIAHGLYP